MSKSYPQLKYSRKKYKAIRERKQLETQALLDKMDLYAHYLRLAKEESLI